MYLQALKWASVPVHVPVLRQGAADARRSGVPQPMPCSINLNDASHDSELFGRLPCVVGTLNAVNHWSVVM